MSSKTGFKKSLAFAVLTGLVACVLAAPVKDHEVLRPDPRPEHSMDILRSCKKTHHKENFSLEDDYPKVPTDGPFRYSRFGIDYFNLARVVVNKHAIARKPAEEDHSAAAVCGHTAPKGHCLQSAFSVFTLQPNSLVHAFQMNRLSFFCLKRGKPTHCRMEFIFSEKSGGKVKWEPLMEYATDVIPGFNPAGAYAPKAVVEFQRMPLLQGFALRRSLSEDTLKNNSTHNTRDTKNTENTDNDVETENWARHNATAFIDNIEFTTWECDHGLDKRPLQGYRNIILKGEDPFNYWNKLEPL